MARWETFVTGPDRRSEVIHTGRYDTCAEAAHLAAWKAFEALPRREQTVDKVDDLAAIKERSDNETGTWWWSLAGTTYGVRQRGIVATG